MKKKVNFISDELKLKVVQEYLSTDISREELKKKYGFSGNNCIDRWMVKFGLSKPDKEQISIYKSMAKEISKTDKEKELERKVAELEKDLDQERLRSRALDKMIDIAERELKIPIRKKSGTKQ
ncbi:MAG TPA: transposase [Prolixibacteraceae bacterium]|nr:transposase [Prolixibacteraceae bacterium]